MLLKQKYKGHFKGKVAWSLCIKILEMAYSFLKKKGIIAWQLNLNITCQHLVKLQIFMYHLFFSKLD